MHIANRRGHMKRLQSWKLHNLLINMDVFGKQLPAFNLRGQPIVHTMTGGIITFSIVVVMLIYASIKMIQMIDHHNPQVAQFTEHTVFDYNEKLDLNEIGFRLAFSVEGYHSREQKNDPRYVKYLVRIFGIKDGKEYERFIPYHKCTD